LEGERVPRVEKFEIRTRLCAIVGLGSGTYGIMKRLMGDDDDRSGWGVSVVVEVGMESEKTCDKGCDATWKLEKREKLAWVEGGGRRKTKVA